MDSQKVKREINPGAPKEGSKTNQPVPNTRVIEIVFVVDATGSMRNYINGVRGSLKEMVKDLNNELKEYQLMFGICFYRDREDKGNNE